MKRIGTLAFVLGAVAVLALACRRGGWGEQSDQVLFSLPHVLNVEHPVHLALVKFADEVERRSGGGMRIKIYAGGTLGNEQVLCDNVSSNADDFTKISSVILETKTDLAKVFSLPYLFRDADHMWKVLDGPIGRELLDMALDQNLKGICYFDAGWRSFYTKHKVASPRDLRGRKIRVQKSVMMQRLMETFGASPQQIAFSELYTAIDTGVVMGAENNIPSYFTTRHYKVAPYFTFTEHVAIPDILLMSAWRWERLTPDQRRVITESAAFASRYQRELWKEKDKQYLEMMQKEGVTFTYLDSKDAFVEATRPMYDMFKGSKVLEYVARIHAVK